MLYKVALTLESMDEFQLCVIYQMKATEQYFLVALYILLYKVNPSFVSADEILSMTIQMKATEQYFPAVLLILLYKVIFSFVSADEILKYDHSNERCYRVVLFTLLYQVIFP